MKNDQNHELAVDLSGWQVTEDLSEMAYVLSHPLSGKMAWFSFHDFREPITPNRIGGVGKDPLAELARRIAAGLRPFRVEGAAVTRFLEYDELGDVPEQARRLVHRLDDPPRRDAD